MEPSLLQRLQTALGTIYGGNIEAHNAEEDWERAPRHRDQYRCDCGESVHFEEWDEAKQCCLHCSLKGGL